MKQLLITIAALVLVGCGEASIHQAARDGNIEAIKRHLEAGTDVNAKNEYGYTPISAVVGGGDKEIAELLIANGADVKAKADNGLTPLHFAAAFGHKEIVELLIAEGADVNAKDDKHKFTPLHDAARQGHKEVAELLIAEGANVNSTDERGETPLDWAMHGKHTETADLLRKHGGKTSAELKAAGN